MADKNKSYSFSKDMASLRSNVDLLESDVTPLSIKRCCDRIRSILDRIQDYRERSYVPYEVKDYFRDEE